MNRQRASSAGVFRQAAFRAAAIVGSMLVTACGGGSSPQATVPPPMSGPAPVPGPGPVAGVVEVDISGIGSLKVASSARWISAKAFTARAEDATPGTAAHNSPSARTKASTLGNLAEGLDLKLQSAGFVDIGTRANGGTRYISATYWVRNASFCGTPGSCPASSQARQNLTFMAVLTAATVNQTAVSRFVRFDGTPAEPALALQLTPTHGMDPTASAVEDERASMQWYRESELPTPDPSATSVLPYGFVVRNVNDGSRTLPALPAVDQFDGQVTFAFALPLQATAADDPYKISLRFQVAQDSSTRVTQSLQEAHARGDQRAQARALALGGSDVAVACGRVSLLRHGNPICQVRLAGPAGAATAILGSAPSSPRIVAAPGGLSAMPRDAAIVLGANMALQAVPASALVVNGSQSGLRTAEGVYAGVVEGGGDSSRPNQMVWRQRAGDRPFFAGETVSFTSVGTEVSTPAGLSVPSFVGSFVVRGSTVAASTGLSVPSSLASSGSPYAVVLGDVNGDGLLDMAVSHNATGRVSVRLGDGSGGFGAATQHTVGANPRSLVFADVDRDGKLDLVVANFGSHTVSVLIGDGHGGFGAAAHHAVGVGPAAVVAGDLNGDGRVDLVTADYTGHSASVLLALPAGGFDTARTLDVGANPRGLTLADLNADGKLDLAVANAGSNRATVMLGDGSGGFAQPSTHAAGAQPFSVLAADLDADGDQDLIVLNSIGETVSVMLGDGAGGFASAVTYAVGRNPDGLVVADVNGDGHLDILTANYLGNSVTVLRGNGAGSFSWAGEHATGTGPRGLCIGDVDGDGRLDVVTANSGSQDLSVMKGQ